MRRDIPLDAMPLIQFVLRIAVLSAASAAAGAQAPDVPHPADDGGTLVAFGDAVDADRALLDPPIEPVPPVPVPPPAPGNEEDAGQVLRDAFRSPARLLDVLRDRVVEPTALFHGPGLLLKQDFDPRHPVAFGMPERWPVFFRFDQDYRLTPSFAVTAETVSLYPDEQDLVASGWLLGEELLRNRANAVAFEVGAGTVMKDGQPDRLPHPESRHLQAAVQRHLPRPGRTRRPSGADPVGLTLRR